MPCQHLNPSQEGKGSFLQCCSSYFLTEFLNSRVKLKLLTLSHKRNLSRLLKQNISLSSFGRKASQWQDSPSEHACLAWETSATSSRPCGAFPRVPKRGHRAGAAAPGLASLLLFGVRHTRVADLSSTSRTRLSVSLHLLP